MAASSAVKIVRDWARYPAVLQVEPPGDVWAISDVHGDYERFVDLLTTAKLIPGMPELPERVVWSGGNATLLTLGDMIDKGPQSLDVLRFARALRSAAEAGGGRAIILMGNHEAEFMADPGADKLAGFAKELRAAGMNPVDVAACHGEMGAFLCSLPFAARAGDWFFSHGGNTEGRTVAKLEADLEAGVDRDGFATDQLIGPDSILEARLTVKPSGGGKKKAERMWTDVDPKRAPKKLLEDYAAALGVHHMVQGHQPSAVNFSDGMPRGAGEMFQRNGLLFLIDTGMSRGVNDSNGAALHIQNRAGKTLATGVCADGKVTKLWQDGLTMAGTHVAACGR